MLATDVQVLDVRVDFRDVLFERPLHLSGGSIDGYTLTIASVTVVGKDGLITHGRGAGVLSIPWAWPVSGLPVPKRDSVLRTLAVRIADLSKGAGPADPLTLNDGMIGDLRAIARGVISDGTVEEDIPPLAAALAVAAVDNGIHDAWARAAGTPAYRLYSPDHVRADILLETPPRFRRRLPVQHVVGLGDPLTSGDPSDSRVSLEDWVRRDGIAHVKVKVAGKDPDGDADRIAAVGAIVQGDPTGSRSISVDPNEGFADIAGLSRMLDRLQRRHPRTYRRVAYIEQPFPRDCRLDSSDIRVAGIHIPLLVDEGLSGPEELQDLRDSGWTGIVIKAAKGQSLAIRGYDLARRLGLYVTVQDLTAVDVALEHSARLASALRLSYPGFEYNSRQYAPRENESLARRRPSLVKVVDGAVSITALPRPGIY